MYSFISTIISLSWVLYINNFNRQIFKQLKLFHCKLSMEIWNGNSSAEPFVLGLLNWESLVNYFNNNNDSNNRSNDSKCIFNTRPITVTFYLFHFDLMAEFPFNFFQQKNYILMAVGFSRFSWLLRKRVLESENRIFHPIFQSFSMKFIEMNSKMGIFRDCQIVLLKIIDLLINISENWFSSGVFFRNWNEIFRVKM